MAKKSKPAPKTKKEAVVRVNCCSAEIMLALEAYLGGVKTGIGTNPTPEGKARLEEIAGQEATLRRMKKILEKGKDQSQGVTIIFTEDLDRVNDDLRRNKLRTLGD